MFCAHCVALVRNYRSYETAGSYSNIVNCIHQPAQVLYGDCVCVCVCVLRDIFLLSFSETFLAIH